MGAGRARRFCAGAAFAAPARRAFRRASTRRASASRRAPSCSRARASWPGPARGPVPGAGAWGRSRRRSLRWRGDRPRRALAAWRVQPPPARPSRAPRGPAAVPSPPRPFRSTGRKRQHKGDEEHRQHLLAVVVDKFINTPPRLGSSSGTGAAAARRPLLLHTAPSSVPATHLQEGQLAYEYQMKPCCGGSRSPRRPSCTCTRPSCVGVPCCVAPARRGPWKSRPRRGAGRAAARAARRASAAHGYRATVL